MKNKQIIKNGFKILSLIPFLCAFLFPLIMKNEIIRAEAHSSQLDVSYDACDYVNCGPGNPLGDGELEKWYELVRNGSSYHFHHESNGVTTLKYYVSETSLTGLTSCSYISDSVLRNHVKELFVNSIKKWNNVFFYKQTDNNTIQKAKLVNIVLGDEYDYDIVICPNNSIVDDAYTYTIDTGTYMNSQNGIQHYHYDKWVINLKLEQFTNYSIENDEYLNKIGAHELGHVLGLGDMDVIEQNITPHHNELLMGYGEVFQQEITYKDLAGVAITRGYHTDGDHLWMYDANNSPTGQYKLICSICNGVKYVNTLTGIDYVTYKYCNDNHTLSDGNMFAVASYGTSDYYKCKYCRYVAPFTDIVSQNYTKTYQNESGHLVTNQVNGLGYSFIEEHTINSNNYCVVCNHEVHDHHYNDHYSFYSSEYHKSYCECGNYNLNVHSVRSGTFLFINGHYYGRCMFCNALVDVGESIIIYDGNSIEPMMVTDNGSYILPNGIYVIVEEDEEADINGTLVFHPSNEVSV